MTLTPTLSLVLALLLGYVLGSIPVAALVSRRRGVDIFSSGTGLAGAANVFHRVGHVRGVAVFILDVAKGTLAIVLARKLGVQGELILLPALAALAGHWRSIFTNFRGGDGLSTLMGITIALVPAYSLMILLTGGVVATMARATGHHSTLWGGATGYSILLLQWPLSGENTTMILGVVVLALMVLVHGVVGHRRRGHASA